MLYLETSALINIPTGRLGEVPPDEAMTSSFALMEFMKSTSSANYKGRRRKLSEITRSSIRIDWDTPIEKIQLMFDYVKIKADQEYVHRLRPLVDAYTKSGTYEELQTKFPNGLSATIEEVE